MPEEEDDRCLEALQVAADEGMRGCRSAKCNRWQCQALATVLGNLVGYSRHWKLFFSQQFRGLKNVVRELVKSVEAARHLASEYGEKDWLSKALVSQENSLGFQSTVEEIEKYVEMINNHLDEGFTNRILDLREKIKLDSRLLHDFLQEAAKKDRLDLNLKVEEQLRSASAIFSRSTRARCIKLAAKLQRRNTSYAQSAFDIEASELIIYKELLGKGSTGSVHKAAWLGLPVAVKVTSREDIHFNRETEIIRGLQPSHPNVVQILGTSEDDEGKRLVVELMDKDLRDFLRSQRVSLRDKVDILLQIANGMFFLHQSDVCYRDLKPQNVLVRTGRRLQIKLADFGHSRNQFLSFDPSLTVPIGTTPYMAPECLRKGSYSKKADVFSFSITCAEVLTGELSTTPNMEERLNRLRSGERPRLPQECPERLRDLIEQCWDFEPENRPAFEEINQVLWEIKEELLMGPVSFSRRASLLGVPSFSRAAQLSTTISRLKTVTSDIAANSSRSEEPAGWFPPLPSSRLHRHFGSGSGSGSSTESGPSTPRTSPGILDLRIEGDCKVGAKLTASWKFGSGTRSCLVQWGRYLQVGAEETDFPNDPTPTKATESEFLITPDYLGTRICMKVLPVAGDLQTGEQAQSVCDNVVSLDAKSQQKLDSHLHDGHVSFDVKIEGQVLAGRLEMSSNEYHLWWSMSNRRNFREKYSGGVSLDVSQEDGTICLLRSSIKNRTYRLRFSDMQKRNLAVVTMRRFMAGNAS